MTKYYCYRKHPERFIGKGLGHTIYGSFPAYKEFMTYEEWVKQGKPNDGSIHFLGLGNQPPQLKKYWDDKRRCQKAIG